MFTVASYLQYTLESIIYYRFVFMDVIYLSGLIFSVLKQAQIMTKNEKFMTHDDMPTKTDYRILI